MCACVSPSVHTCVPVSQFLNRYKTANDGWILDFNVSIEAYSHSVSNYHFRILKNNQTWWPS